MRVVLITGISGSGKSVALNELEDANYFCIDNLPMQFLQEVISSLAEAGHERVAVSIDARAGQALNDLRDIVAGLSRFGHDVKLIFLNARIDTLIQRYSESRRRHPLGLIPKADGEYPTLSESIDREREILSVLEHIGVSIDTSDLKPAALRQWIRDVIGAERSPITLLFESFAFKSGVPLDADLVFDVRCLPNPYYDPILRPLNGRDAPVQEYLGSIPSVGRMVDHVANFLNTWLPHYILDNRSYLTVAIGCTGGQHRSVYCVEKLAERFKRTETVLVRHRSLSAKQFS